VIPEAKGPHHKGEFSLNGQLSDDQQAGEGYVRESERKSGLHRNQKGTVTTAKG
jgi:hypothetical protein